MPQILKDKPPLVRRGRPKKYDIQSWIETVAKGKPLQLTKGMDYKCLPNSISGMIYAKAAALGYIVQIMVNGNNVVILTARKGGA